MNYLKIEKITFSKIFRAIGIHMIAKSCGAELFVLQSDGFIIVYDIFHGEKKRSFSISEDVSISWIFIF